MGQTVTTYLPAIYAGDDRVEQLAELAAEAGAVVGPRQGGVHAREVIERDFYEVGYLLVAAVEHGRGQQLARPEGLPLVLDRVSEQVLGLFDYPGERLIGLAGVGTCAGGKPVQQSAGVEYLPAVGGLVPAGPQRRLVPGGPVQLALLVGQLYGGSTQFKHEGVAAVVTGHPEPC